MKNLTPFFVTVGTQGEGENFVLKKPLAETKYSGAEKTMIPYGGLGLKINNPAWFGEKRIPGLTLAPGLNVDGEAIGADKIGHFFQEGYSAYSQGMDEKQTREFSKNLENGLHGKANTGVFSNGDIEANVSGNQFYQDLSESFRSNPKQAFQFDIRNYVNSGWNENKNPNSYTSALQGVVNKNGQN